MRMVIQILPINRIKVLNPRSRNPKVFNQLVASIAGSRSKTSDYRYQIGNIGWRTMVWPIMRRRKIDRLPRAR